MTPTGKPDDDHEVEGPEPAQSAQVPPPPQWLDDQQTPPTPLLLPDYGDEEEAEPEGGPAAAGESGSGASEDDTDGDGTGSGSDSDETAHTVVIGRRPATTSPSDEETPGGDSPSGDTPQPVPPAAPPTSTDIPAPPPFPYAQDVPDATRAEKPPASFAREDPDVTRVEPLPTPPAAGPPPPPSQSPPAHEPFPYAQEIPGAPAPPAPEPFPYAQEIPGASPPPLAMPSLPPAGPPAPPAAEPFPWAQQIPGAAQPMQEAGRPMAPPPAMDEPWRTPGAPTRPRRNVGKPLLIGVAALAVAGLVAAGVLVVPGLFGGDDQGDGAEGAKLAASLFPVDGAARTDGRDQEITSVAAVGSTVVAVGSEADPQNARGLFLVSGDNGRTFESVTQRGADGDGAASGGVPVAVGGSERGWIAIGTRAGGGGAVWTSEDGRQWRGQPDAVGDVFGAGNRVRRIVVTGNGYLAIGEYSRKRDFTDARPAVWLSGDGRRWEARVGDEIGVQVRKGTFSLVEAASSGNVILLEGLVTPDSGKPGPYRVVWRSEDGGRTWSVSNVPVPKGSRGLMIGGGQAGFLAVREVKSSGGFQGQAFTSKDGGSWTKAGALRMSGYQRTSRIIGDGGGYVAVVVRGQDVLLSRSSDGASWKDAGTTESKPGREFMGAALAGGQAILVGREPGGGDMDPMLGVWDSAGAAVPVDLTKIRGAIRPDHAVRSVGATEDLAIAVGSARGDAAVWSSRDGSSWKPVQGLGAAFTRPGPQQLNDVAGGASGWLAVGYDQAAPRRPLVVTSKDGATWQAADADPAFGGGRAGTPVTYAATAGNGGFVVVGTEGFSVATWFTADLKGWVRGAGTDPKMMQGDKNGGRWMLDVAAGPSGYAAVGGSRDAGGNHPSVWSSPDGKTWTLRQLPLPGGVTEGHLTHVTARGSTLVATGLAATRNGLDWLGYVSADGGGSWRPLASPSGGTQVIVTALTATPKGFAATGTTGPAGANDVVSWTSPDGSSWTAATPGGTGLGGAGDQQITGLAAFKSTLLGVGRSADAGGDQPVLWARAD